MWGLVIMINRLIVRNLLSIRELDITLDKINVLVGPNASGKSNIVRALQLIQSLTQGAPQLPGYTYEALHFAYNMYHEPIVVSIWSGDVNVSLSIGGEKYVEEVLRGRDVLLRHDGEGLSVNYRDRAGSLKGGPLPLYDTVGFMNTRKNVYRSVFSLKPPLDSDPDLDKVFKLVRNIGVFSFVPQSIRARSSIKEMPVVGYNGEHLARFLLELYLKRRKDFSRIESVLSDLVGEVEEIVPSIEGEHVEIRIKVKGIEEPLPPQNISDGTLRLLALVTVLNAGYSVVAIEEPENCIYPRLLEAFVDLARKSPSQVIITTHSPYLLDHFKPEEVYLVSKRGLETVVTRLSDTKEVEAVKRFLEEGGTLGEAWYSGIFR